MPDITIKTRLALDLQLALQGRPDLPGIEVLSPPMTPKGRYALAKATTAVTTALKPYEKARGELVEQHAEKVDGKNVTPAPGQVKLRDVVAFNKDLEPMLDEDLTLSGVRQITRDELGACPITAFHERILLAAGLLPDVEPN